MTASLPPEADALLAAQPEEFVRRRDGLARSLRSEGRREDGDAVQALRKPPPLVLAVNRAARDRPRAARSAVDAAERVAKEQVGGNRDAFEMAAAELDSSLELLAEVALAQLSRGGKTPSESMRVRLRTLLRAAASDADARSALARGVLTHEIEAHGFEAFVGLELPKRRPPRGASRSAPAADRRRARELERRVREARQHLRAADERVRDAERERDEAAEKLQALEAELDGT